MSYLAIDPGVDTGWAYFRWNSDFLRCGLGDPRKLTFDHADPVECVIIECPQVYSARLSKGDPNDLIKLAVRVGRYAEYFEHVHKAKLVLVLPAEWKGQLPKEVTEVRARESLCETERARVGVCMRDIAKSKQHNVWDAISLGRTAFEKKLWPS